MPETVDGTPKPEAAKSVSDVEYQMLGAIRDECFEIQRKRMKQAPFIWLGLVAVFIWAMGGFAAAFGDFYFYLGVVGGTGLLADWVYAQRRRYARSYKDIIFPHIARTFNMQYSRAGGVPIHLFSGTGGVPQHVKCETEDYFFGEYHGEKIHLSEIKLSERTGEFEQKATKEIFSGVAIVIELKKPPFLGHTVILPKVRPYKLNLSGLKPVDLVDPVFGADYSVFSNDQVEARFLVHPVVVENFSALSAPFFGKKVSVSFYQGRILVLIPVDQNLFEPPSMWADVSNFDGIVSVKAQIAATLTFVDRLGLYKKRPQ